MLNELSLAADSLERLGISPDKRHPSLTPMRNETALVVGLDNGASPSLIEFFPSKVATNLLRVRHGSEGSSFPGFNIPVPLRCFKEDDRGKASPLLERLIRTAKSTTESTIHNILNELFAVSLVRVFTPPQESQFQRSLQELVGELHELLVPVGSQNLRSFMHLLEILKNHPQTLSGFSEKLASRLLSANSQFSKEDMGIIQYILFGDLDWKKRKEDIGSTDYWNTKSKLDNPKQNKPSVSVYLDLAPEVADFANDKRIAHVDTWKQINALLLSTTKGMTIQELRDKKKGEKIESPKKKRNTVDSTQEDDMRRTSSQERICAFSGTKAILQDKFPNPTIATLGPIILFSVNDGETPALRRYGRGGSALFPVSKERVQKMSDALRYLANNAKIGETCKPIPGVQSKKGKPGQSNLLIAYLENDTTARGDDIPGMAEMFGCETSVLGVSEGDFSERAKKVLQLFSAKLHSNPDLGVRLIALGTIDPGRKQATLNRAYRVFDVIEYAKQWNDAARNIPRISILSHFEEAQEITGVSTEEQPGKKRISKKQKTKQKGIFREAGIPSPIDLVVTINRVWSSDPKAGFVAAYQRAFSVADAYDIFIPLAPQVAEPKTRFALSLLIARMASVLGAIGAAKTARQDAQFSDTVREQTLKTVALLGLLLKKLNPITNHKDTYMKEPLYQLGQLLALADKLHHAYCTDVRAGQVPSQLIGNALFNTALEQPVLAIARLGERIAPYQAWAKTCKINEKPDEENSPKNIARKTGKKMLRLFGNSCSLIRTDELPERMSDEDKAKLLIGYLADTYEPEKAGAPRESGPPAGENDAS